MLIFSTANSLCSKFVVLSAELDEFYGRFDWSKRKSLWRFIKKVLVLCHGSAALESGFSTNKMMVDYNMDPGTIVAMRQVHEGIRRIGGTLKVPITTEMRISVRGARTKYRQYLEMQKQQSGPEAAEKSKKEEEINVLKATISRLETDAVNFEKKAEELCLKAEAKMDLKYVSEANALRKASKEKRQESDERKKLDSLK